MEAVTTLDWSALAFESHVDNSIAIASLTSSFLYLLYVRSSPSSLRAFYKVSATGLLSLLAYRQGGLSAQFLGPALALGTIGDGFLAWSGDKNFLKGLTSFLVAHLFYIALFWRIGGGLDAFWAEKWHQYIAGGMLLLAPIMNLILMPNVSRTLQTPVAAYSAVILVMVLSVLTLNNETIITGATLFALSDAILSTEEFVMPKQSIFRAWMQYSVWILYYSGQSLITWGFLRG